MREIFWMCLKTLNVNLILKCKEQKTFGFNLKSGESFCFLRLDLKSFGGPPERLRPTEFKSRQRWLGIVLDFASIPLLVLLLILRHARRLIILNLTCFRFLFPLKKCFCFGFSSVLTKKPKRFPNWIKLRRISVSGGKKDSFRRFVLIYASPLKFFAPSRPKLLFKFMT